MTEKQQIIAYSALAAGAQSVIALVTNSFPVFFGASGPSAVIGMLEIFYNYATRAVTGEVPYRDYLVEYPILGFVIILAPRLLVSGFAAYRVAIGAELLLFNAAAVFLVARHVAATEGFDRVPPRLGWYTAFFACLCPLLMGPYDLAPMAVAFAAAAFWFSGRNTLGGVTAGLGFLLKIFPAAVVAPALVWEVTRIRQSRGRGFLAFLATVATGMAVWLVIGGRRVADSFLYHTERGLQLESVYAGVLMLYGKATGQRVTWEHNHFSFHITSDWGGRLPMWSLPIQLAAILLVMWQYRRSGMKDGVRYAGASVLAFMLWGKVLSTNFPIWLIPFVAAVGGQTGRRARWIYLLVCLATTVYFPLIGFNLLLVFNDLWSVILLNFRNALFLLLFFILVFGKESEAVGTPTEPSDSLTAKESCVGSG